MVTSTKGVNTAGTLKHGISPNWENAAYNALPPITSAFNWSEHQSRQSESSPLLQRAGPCIRLTLPSTLTWPTALCLANTAPQLCVSLSPSQTPPSAASSTAWHSLHSHHLPMHGLPRYAASMPLVGGINYYSYNSPHGPFQGPTYYKGVAPQNFGSCVSHNLLKLCAERLKIHCIKSTTSAHTKTVLELHVQ